MNVVELAQLKEQEIMNAFVKILEEQTGEPVTEVDAVQYYTFKTGYIAGEAPSGNQYTGYLKEGNVTWNKVRPDEPVFVLRAQDKTAPGIVLKWIAESLDTVSEAKLKEAFQTVLAMRRYDSRRDPT